MRTMSKTTCVFCGEKEATKTIFDPNWFPKTELEHPPTDDPKRWWKVCADCFDFIMFRKCGSPPWMLEIRPNLKKTIEKSFCAIIDPKRCDKK